MSASEAPAATGYRLTLPPGWSRLTTGDGAAESVDRYLDGELRRLSGADRVLAERELGARLRSALARAEEAGALDLYVSNIRVGDRVFSTRFTIAVAFLGASAADLDDADLAGLAAIDPIEASGLRLAGERAVRTVERRSRHVSELRSDAERAFDAAADPERLLAELPADSATARQVESMVAAEAAGTRVDEVRVSYLVAVPRSHGAYLLAVLDLVENPLLEQQIELFDAIVSTLRWVS